MKTKLKKTARYSLGTPAVALGSLTWSTALGIKHIAKTTTVVVKAIGKDTYLNSRSYIDEVKGK
jgi:hypothetical protein